MKINNLKYSIWEFIFSLIFTIPILIGTIICFKENDLLFAIIYLLVFIIALILIYFSIKDIQWFEINSNSIIVKNIFGVIKKIEINNIKKDNIEFLFKYLKTLLNNRIIIKVIYKKEFIIIHFNKIFHIDLIKNKSMLYSIPLYKYIEKNNINNLKIYFYCIFKYKNVTTIIPFVIKNKEKIYLFDNNPKEVVNLNNIEIIYLYRVKKRGYQNFRCLQILNNLNTTFDNLYKLII